MPNNDVVFYGNPYKIILKGDNKLKKFITTLCLIFSLVFAFSSFGCGKSDWKVGYTKGTVASNGGFAVEIQVANDESYTYFINGVGDSTANNEFGTPVKGSLVRVKTSELKNGADAASAEVVVPKLLVSSFYGSDVGYQSGLTIFGDYVYYGTPNTEKDKTGNVLNSQIVFQKTKLDGTSTGTIATVEGLGTGYRFSQDTNGKVYLTVIERIAGSSDEDPATYDISVYNENGDELFVREAVDSLILPYEFTGDYIFYTDLEKAEDDQDKKYSAIYAYHYGDEDDKVLLSGKSQFYGGNAENGSLGRTYIVDKFVNNHLFFSYLLADSADGTARQYCYLDLTKLGKADSKVKLFDKLKEEPTDAETDTFKEANGKNIEEIEPMGGSKNVQNSVLPTALYNFNENGFTDIVYFDSTLGVVSFDYNQVKDSPYYGITQLVPMSKIDIASPVFKCFIDDYAYFTDSSSFVYRIKYKNFADDEEAEMKQLTTVAVKTDWYLPEVIGGQLLVSVTAEPYNSYVYSFGLDLEADANAYFTEELKDSSSEANKAKEDGELVDLYSKEVANNEEKAIEYIANKRVGVLDDDDKEVVGDYIEALTSSASSVSSST